MSNSARKKRKVLIAGQSDVRQYFTSATALEDKDTGIESIDATEGILNPSNSPGYLPNNIVEVLWTERSAFSIGRAMFCTTHRLSNALLEEESFNKLFNCGVGGSRKRFCTAIKKAVRYMDSLTHHTHSVLMTCWHLFFAEESVWKESGAEPLNILLLRRDIIFALSATNMMITGARLRFDITKRNRLVERGMQIWKDCLQQRGIAVRISDEAPWPKCPSGLAPMVEYEHQKWCVSMTRFCSYATVYGHTERFLSSIGLSHLSASETERSIKYLLILGFEFTIDSNSLPVAVHQWRELFSEVKNLNIFGEVENEVGSVDINMTSLLAVTMLRWKMNGVMSNAVEQLEPTGVHMPNGKPFRSFRKVQYIYAGSGQPRQKVTLSSAGAISSNPRTLQSDSMTSGHGKRVRIFCSVN